MYDVIIVGARVAGSALAIHLAKQGIQVLMVDRTTFPRDTLSTHFLWARGVSYLNRLGVLEAVLEHTPSFRRMQFVMEDLTIEGQTPLPLVSARLERVHGDAHGATDLQLSVRRKFLDYLLIQEAIKQGVEFREGFAVEALLQENGRVVGVEGPKGERLRARLVVGADGKNSRVAELLAVPKKEIRRACSFAQYSYFTGLGLTTPTIRKKGRLACGIVPTNDNAFMTLVFGPKDWFPAFRSTPETNFQRALDYISPELGERVRAQGERQEPYYATADQAAFLRDPIGPGYLLVGDAASFKDQCTASGMTHALRDAELAAVAIGRALSTDEAPAFREYRAKRSLDAFRYYEFVASQAEMNPLRPDEYQFFEALSHRPQDSDRFVATYGDTLPVRDFFADESTQAILAGRVAAPLDLESHRQRLEGYYDNPFSDETRPLAERVSFSRTCVDFANPVGPDLLGRTAAYSDWVAQRNQSGTWQYSRTLEAFPGPTSRLTDDLGRKVDGINFASQDYLALGAHPALREAAVRALHDFGPHSAGSPMVIGNTTLSQKLERELAETLHCQEVVLFPTGWAAGFGSITALVRPHDHIVMDKLAHACLQQGAYAATDKIHRHAHLDVESARAILKDIRSRDKRNGILVVSEGIYSMDSDAPDLAALQEACHEYGATLFVDIAHDFGASGPGGTGQIGLQGMLGKIDLVMGSFSKTFASNGGFLASNARGVRQFVKMFGNPHIFSNALSPVQTAVVSAGLGIVRSPEGDQLREKLLDVVCHLRSSLKMYGHAPLGLPSAIVPVPIGDEKLARLAHRGLQERNIAAMILEYPVVATGSARFRLQVMASHTREQAAQVAEAISDVLEEAALSPVLSSTGHGGAPGLERRPGERLSGLALPLAARGSAPSAVAQTSRVPA